MEKVKVDKPTVDKEWEYLIFKAKNMGFEIEEIRKFLSLKSKKQ